MSEQLYVSRYATLLASQGCLTSALVYLGNTGSNPQLQELKERLDNALAGHGTGAAVQQNRSSTGPGVQQTRPGYAGQGSLPGSVPGSRRQSHQVSAIQSVIMLLSY